MTITEQEFRQVRRRRANMLKFIRIDRERQIERTDDSMIQESMRDIGSNMSSRQVLTMLQDLQTFGYVTFTQSFSDELERYVAEDVTLTPLGLTAVVRRKDNDELLFS